VFSAEAIEALQGHGWPGNVRELANVVEHAMILADALPVGPEHLPSRFAKSQPRPPAATGSEPCTLRELEMQAIHSALERHDGNKPAAAEELGISLKTLYNKLNQAAGLKKSA